MPEKVNVCVVVQNGEMLAMALLLAASYSKFDNEGFQLYLCSPINSKLWNYDVEVNDPAVLEYLDSIGVKMNYFDNDYWGQRYPHSNKAYAIATLPENEPFILFDTDHLFVNRIGDLDFKFDDPSFIRGPNSWPPEIGTHYSTGFSKRETWDDVYNALKITPEDIYKNQYDDNDWDKYPYYNASLLYYREAGVFAKTYLKNMQVIWDSDAGSLPKSILYPELDQVVLPATAYHLGCKPDIYKFEHFRILRWVHYHKFPFLHFFEQNFDFVTFIAELISNDKTLLGLLLKVPEFSHYFSYPVFTALQSLAESYDDEINVHKIRKLLIEENWWYSNK